MTVESESQESFKPGSNIGVTTIVVEFRLLGNFDYKERKYHVKRDIFDLVALNIPDKSIKETQDGIKTVDISVLIDLLLRLTLDYALLAENNDENDFSPLPKILFIDFGRSCLYRTVVGGMKTNNYALWGSGENHSRVLIDDTAAVAVNKIKKG